MRALGTCWDGLGLAESIARWHEALAAGRLCITVSVAVTHPSDVSSMEMAVPLRLCGVAGNVLGLQLRVYNRSSFCQSLRS